LQIVLSGHILPKWISILAIIPLARFRTASLEGRAGASINTTYKCVERKLRL